MSRIYRVPPKTLAIRLSVGLLLSLAAALALVAILMAQGAEADATSTTFDPATVILDIDGASETITVKTEDVDNTVGGVQLNIQHSDTLQISAPACVGIFTGALSLPVQTPAGSTSIGCTFIGTTVSGTTGDVMTFVVTRIGDFTEPQLVTFDLVGDDRSRLSIAGVPVEVGDTNDLTVLAQAPAPSAT